MGEFEKLVVKLQCFTEEREKTFGSIYQEVLTTEGLINRDSTVYCQNSAHKLIHVRNKDLFFSLPLSIS